jgi:hypothetical protein
LKPLKKEGEKILKKSVDGRLKNILKNIRAMKKGEYTTIGAHVPKAVGLQLKAQAMAAGSRSVSAFLGEQVGELLKRLPVLPVEVLVAAEIEKEAAREAKSESLGADGSDAARATG